MRDYLNANERNQFMVLQSIVQMMDGLRNSGVDGPKIPNMLEDWKARGNLTKDEHRNLKTAETYLRKYLSSVYERLGKKERDVIKKKITNFDFKLVDDYTLKQLDRDLKDKLAVKSIILCKINSMANNNYQVIRFTCVKKLICMGRKGVPPSYPYKFRSLRVLSFFDWQLFHNLLFLIIH